MRATGRLGSRVHLRRDESTDMRRIRAIRESREEREGAGSRRLPIAERREAVDGEDFALLPQLSVRESNAEKRDVFERTLGIAAAELCARAPQQPGLRSQTGSS